MSLAKPHSRHHRHPPIGDGDSIHGASITGKGAWDWSRRSGMVRKPWLVRPHTITENLQMGATPQRLGGILADMIIVPLPRLRDAKAICRHQSRGDRRC